MAAGVITPPKGFIPEPPPGFIPEPPPGFIPEPPAGFVPEHKYGEAGYSNVDADRDFGPVQPAKQIVVPQWTGRDVALGQRLEAESAARAQGVAKSEQEEAIYKSQTRAADTDTYPRFRSIIRNRLDVDRDTLAGALGVASPSERKLLDDAYAIEHGIASRRKILAAGAEAENIRALDGDRDFYARLTPDQKIEVDNVLKDEDRQRISDNIHFAQIEAGKALGSGVIANTVGAGIMQGFTDANTAKSWLSGDDMGARTSNRFAKGVDEAALPGMLPTAIRGAARSLSVAAPAGVVGGPAGAILSGALATGAQSYANARDEGKTVGESWRYGLTDAALEGGIAGTMQLVGLGGMEKVFSRQAAKGGLKSALLSLGKDSLSELTEEELTTLGQQLNAKLSGVDPDALSDENLAAAIRDTAVQTLITMGATRLPGLAASAVESMQQPVRRYGPDMSYEQYAQTQQKIADQPMPGMETAVAAPESLPAQETAPVQESAEQAHAVSRPLPVETQIALEAAPQWTDKANLERLDNTPEQALPGMVDEARTPAGDAAPGMVEAVANPLVDLVNKSVFGETNSTQQEEVQAAQVAEQTSNLPEIKPEETTAGVPEGGITDPEAQEWHTSARQAALDEDRSTLGLDSVPSKERKGWQESLSNARANGIPERALRISEDVLSKPRPLNDEETAGLVVKAAQLKREHQATLAKMEGASEADIATNAAEAERIEQEFDLISKALYASGTEKGRALAAQKLTINRDYSLIAVKNRARAKKGKALTAQESAKLETVTKQLEEANAAVDRLQKQLSEKNAEQVLRSGRRPKQSVAWRKDELAKKVSRVKELLAAGC
jgi:hypothetical protein